VDVTPRTVAVMVDELVLDGVDPGDALVAEAMRDALAPALGEHGMRAAARDAAGAVARGVAREAR
jgi:hypothetical protein